VTAGLFAMIGILLALRVKERTGIGQFVDVSMLDSMISTMSSNYASYLGSGIVPQPMGTAFPTVVPYRVFQTQDRAIAIAVGSDKLWCTFCEEIERPELEKYPDYATNAARIRNRGVLEPLLEDVFRQRTAAEWIGRLQGAGIPASLVRNFQEVVEHPQCDVRQMFPTLQHPVFGPHRVSGTPVKLSETPGGTGAAAPLLGEHTAHALAELLGLDGTTLDALAARGIILAPDPACPPEDVRPGS
jgi:crotonobetainyl-CoA:carnitine CoA-transferase CaiB-like acyl-CoA transferase